LAAADCARKRALYLNFVALSSQARTVSEILPSTSFSQPENRSLLNRGFERFLDVHAVSTFDTNWT
jgi:hypothetical protein